MFLLHEVNKNKDKNNSDLNIPHIVLYNHLMNQFLNAWSFFLKNWKDLLPIAMPLFILSLITMYYVGPLVTPYLNANQFDQLQDFLEDNNLYLTVLDLIYDIAFIAFVAAINAQFYILTINKQPLRTSDLFSKSLSKIIWLFIASFLSSLFIGIGFIFFILPGIYLFVRFSLFPVFIIIEDQGPVSSLMLSWEMTDQYGGQLFSQTILFFMIMLLVFILSSIIFSIFGQAITIAIIFIEFYVFCIVLSYLYFSLYKSVKNL